MNTFTNAMHPKKGGYRTAPNQPFHNAAIVTIIKVFGILAVISLLISGCAARPAQAGQDEHRVPKTAVYASILGKHLNDDGVVEFSAPVPTNSCSAAPQV